MAADDLDTSEHDAPPPAPTPSLRWPTTVIAAGGWAYVVVVTWLLLTLVFGIEGPLSFTVLLQSLTPFAFLPAFVVAPLAWWRSRRILALVCAAVLLVGAVLVLPRAAHRTVPTWAQGAPHVRVLEANVFDRNAQPRAAAEALLAQQADVMVLVEMRPAFLDALDAAGVLEQYPYRSVGKFRPRTGNVEGIYSKIPFDDPQDVLASGEYFLSVHLQTAGPGLTILGVHIDSAVHGLGEWQRELRAVRHFATDTSGAMAVVGDFNATRWSPSFHDFLDAGFHDAHEDTGRGLSTSWPDRRLPFAVMRIDHALLRGDVAALGVTDVHVPGSDHIGFVAVLAVK